MTFFLLGFPGVVGLLDDYINDDIIVWLLAT